MRTSNKQFQHAMECLGVRVIQDNYVEWRGCERKRPYSESYATKTVNRLRVKGEKDIDKYFCENCCAWHVGHRKDSK